MSDPLIGSEIIKHNSIIQSDNRKLSFLDKKISNVLLINSFPDLDKGYFFNFFANYPKDRVGQDYSSDIIESIQTLSNIAIR